MSDAGKYESNTEDYWTELNGSEACDFLCIFFYVAVAFICFDLAFFVLAFNITAPLVIYG